MSDDEVKLLRRINQPIPAGLHRRYRALAAKRRAETLTPGEHAELLELVDQIESLDALRVEALAALARLRNVTLTQLMKEVTPSKRSADSPP